MEFRDCLVEADDLLGISAKIATTLQYQFIDLIESLYQSNVYVTGITLSNEFAKAKSLQCTIDSNLLCVSNAFVEYDGSSVMVRRRLATVFEIELAGCDVKEFDEDVTILPGRKSVLTGSYSVQL